MNIAVVSPDNRGIGVTSLAILLGIDMTNKGNSVVVTSLAPNKSALREYIGDIPSDLGDIENGMRDMLRVKEAGTLVPDDIRSYCIDVGVDIMIRSNGLSAKDVASAIEFISSSNINGRSVTAIVDVDIDDMRRPEVEMEITAADVVIVVLSQNVIHLRKFKENRANMAKAFAKKKVLVVVNKYDKFAGSMKDIWSKAGMKYGDGWFEVRYNPCVPLMTSKCFIQQAADAMKSASDPDIATLKADIARISAATEKRR